MPLKETMKYPRFKYSFRVETVPKENAVFLLSETKSFVLSGQLYVVLAPLLDGSNTIERIISLLGFHVPADMVRRAINKLEASGYLTDAAEDVDPREAAFWERFEIPVSQAKQGLADSAVNLIDLGDHDLSSLSDRLSSLGIAVRDNAAFTVVVTDDYLNSRLAGINEDFITAQTPWMLLKPAGSIVWTGPIFSPGQTGCWRCLADRLAVNREIESSIQALSGGKTAYSLPPVSLPVTRETAYSSAATEIAIWFATGTSHLLQEMTTYDTCSVELGKHRFSRRPQCSVCGDYTASPPEPLTLESRPKLFSDDGGYRVITAEETFARNRGLVSPLTGIITEVQQVFHEGDGLINVAFAGHGMFRNAGSLGYLRTMLSSKSAGKGRSAFQAQVSGMCEAVERYSMQYSGDEYTVRDSAEGLGEAAMHPNDCMLFSRDQFSRRDELNAIPDGSYIPEPFDTRALLDWSPVWSFERNDFRYLPTDYCYYAAPQSGFCAADSNGNAVGNVLEEAILQGFLELVERDAIALWWYSRAKRPAFDTGSLGDSYYDRVRDYYHSIGREFYLLDISTEFGIPVFAALSKRSKHPGAAFIFGFGAHFDPGLAALRAVTEMHQYLYLSQRSGAENDDPEMTPAQSPCGYYAPEEQYYLVPESAYTPVSADRYPVNGHDDLRDVIEYCADIMSAHGMELLVLDQSRHDVPLKAVKVFVPGLYHYNRRFAEGRLYTVPHTLGWVPKALTEPELNPARLTI